MNAEFFGAVAHVKELMYVNAGSVEGVMRISCDSTSSEESFLCALAKSSRLSRAILWAQGGFLGGCYYADRHPRLMGVIDRPNLNVRLGQRISEVITVLNTLLARSDISLHYVTSVIDKEELMQTSLNKLPDFIDALPVTQLDAESCQAFIELLKP